jgi:hypothetical protein
MKLRIELNRPNETQMIPLALVTPKEDQPRRFIEKASLADLREVYRQYNTASNSSKVVLPDPPILRYDRAESFLEIIAGERRITAALEEDVVALPCRVVDMSASDAFLFAMRHNNVVSLTAPEKAYFAREMDLLGFSTEEISTELGDVAAYRYVTVGALLDADMFTDTAKLCDLPITVWYEAALHGEAHFKYCFEQWNNGLWDEATCRRRFRVAGSLPVDTNEKGIRVSITHDGRRALIRGVLDLDLHSPDEIIKMVTRATTEYRAIALEGIANPATGFGARTVRYFNPDTL